MPAIEHTFWIFGLGLKLLAAKVRLLYDGLRGSILELVWPQGVSLMGLGRSFWHVRSDDDDEDGMRAKYFRVVGVILAVFFFC